MTSVYESVQEDMAAILSEQFGINPTEVDFRADVPAGTNLGETDLGGGSKVRWLKQESKVRLGGKALPDRFRAYHAITGKETWLPLVQMAHYLSKPGEDGRPAFVRTRPAHIVDPEPIDETCDVCAKRRALLGQPPRAFYDYADLVGHYESLHPREWGAKLRQEDRDMQKQQSGDQRDILLAIKDSLALMAVAGGSTSYDSDEKPIRRRRARQETPQEATSDD